MCFFIFPKAVVHLGVDAVIVAGSVAIAAIGLAGFVVGLAMLGLRAAADRVGDGLHRIYTA